MSKQSHLWVIGYDDIDRAEQVRQQIEWLGGDGQYLLIYEMAVVIRRPDGTITLNREEPSAVAGTMGGGLLGLLVGLALAASPLTSAAVGAVLGCVAGTAVHEMGIDEDFIRKAAECLRPGTSALFVLDDVGDLEVVLHTIRGLGGTVLKTNVDVERAKLIQSTLKADSPQ